jgi:hypothetical protein
MLVLPATAQLPTSVDDFSQKVAATDDPAEAAELFFQAVYVYTHEDKDLGEDLLEEILIDAKLERDMPTLYAALEETPWVFDSYAEGTSAENGYEGIDPQAYELEVMDVETVEPKALLEDEMALVYFASTGSDDPRPVILKSVDGGWRVATATPLVAGVRSADGNPGVDIAGTATPEGVIHLFLEATYLYSTGMEDEGEYLLYTILSPDGYENDIVKLLRVVEEEPINVWAYAQGNGPEDAYLDFDPFAFQVKITRTQELQDDLIKAFIDCPGADNPRPFQCHLTRRGQLRMYEFSSMRLDVKQPETERW